ncbi:MAG: YraN family protein [Candidatus Berkiellales bacterium]
MSDTPKRIIGNYTEKLAKEYLLKKGLTFIFEQFRSPFGEIDLIMKHKNEIAIIEVRYRKNNFYGDPEETVTWHKQQRLIYSAMYFQQNRAWAQEYSLRFDIVSISGVQPNLRIIWIPDAFGVN